MILDHVRFRPAGLDVPMRDELWTLAIVTEDDTGFLAHKLLVSELRQVLALPETLGKFAPDSVAVHLASRVAELQAIVDKRDRQWDPVIELFRPDMNVSDITLAIKRLLALFNAYDFGHGSSTGASHLLACRAALWVDRTTQPEKDQTAASAGPRLPERDIALTDALERGARRLATAEALIDKRDDRQWDPVIELFHPDMNVTDIQRAVTKLLELFTRTQEFFRVSSHLFTDQPVRDMLAECYTALWSGRKTQLEKDEVIRAPQGVRDAAQQDNIAEQRGATAEALWSLLDDISTLSDSIKPHDLESYQRFCRRASDIAERRHRLLKSDGYKLTWPDGTTQEQQTAAKLEDLAEAVENAVGGQPWGCEFPENQSLVFGVAQLFDKARAATEPKGPLVRTEADASFWRDRYEDLKLGIGKRLSGEHVQPTYEENAVLLARVPGKLETPGTVPMLHRDLVHAIEHAVDGNPVFSECSENHALVRRVQDLFGKASRPVPMLLHCPMCHARHIDEGEFATKPHKDHACQSCGHCWRPALVPTVGVRFLPGYKNQELVGGVPVDSRVTLDNGYTGRVVSYDADAQLYRIAGVGSSVRCKREEFTVIE